MSKIIFPRFIFTIYDIGIRRGTRGYSGLQGVKGGFKELQSYNGGHGVTRGYKGLQGDTKVYRNFFLTRTFPHTFSSSILHKNQS